VCGIEDAAIASGGAAGTIRFDPGVEDAKRGVLGDLRTGFETQPALATVLGGT